MDFAPKYGNSIVSTVVKLGALLQVLAALAAEVLVGLLVIVQRPHCLSSGTVRARCALRRAGAGDVDILIVPVLVDVGELDFKGRHSAITRASRTCMSRLADDAAHLAR